MPEQERALLASPRVRVAVAAAALLVLVAGYLLRPEIDLPPPPAAESLPAPILRQTVAAQEVASLFDTARATALASLRFTARLSAPAATDRWSDWEGPPALDRERYGVVLTERHLLGEAADVAPGVPVQVHLGDNRNTTGRVVRRLPGSALAIVELDTNEALAVPPAAVPADVTEIVMAVAPGPGGPIVAPLFVAGIDGGSTLVTGADPRYRGMGVFAPTGGLVGVLSDSPDGLRVRTTADLLSEQARIAPQPVGVSLARDGDGDTAGESQVVVSAVAPGSRAAAAGLRPRDVLLDVDGTPVVTVAAAASALQAGADRIRVRRNRRVLSLALPPAGTAAR